ncbi:inosine monophosphate dehydrogenase [Aspergillus egyptiacus]|nr:inosine monophosphate dehydrogenase [Aspergillus egyptiacus]
MSSPIQLTTKLSAIYPWVSAPFIVSAPMRVMSGPSLAVAVSRAGGLGFIGPRVKTMDMIPDLEEASTLVRDVRASSSAFNTFTQSLLPIGVGFQLWSDDIEIAIRFIQEYKPCAAWLYAPSGEHDIETWSRKIRHASSATQIWVQIGTLSEVKDLLRMGVPERPDIIVVQGSESGGHGRAKDGMGLISLLPEIADELASENCQIPLFAAGGIADGRGAAAALCLGASGVVMGTRFLASSEARISKGYQDALLQARDGARATTRTLLYNHLRGTFGWPKEYSPRTVINKSFVEHNAGRSFDELKELHDHAQKHAGDAGWGPEGRLATYAGASVGLVNEVKDAATIVRDVQEQVLGKFPSSSLTPNKP